MSEPIDPKRIRTDLDTQSRIGLNEDTVNEYAEAMEAGQEFPAILAFDDDSTEDYILADGFHRFAAHMLVRPNEPILAEIRPGTVDEARWESIGANKSHGLRRTNGDKRNAVKQALSHPKGATLSNRQIAAHVGVAESTVRNIRQELESTAQIAQSTDRIGQDGRTINTERIGKTEPALTCATCRFFIKGCCTACNTEPVPWTPACEKYDASPDVPKVSGDPEKTVNHRRASAHQYRRLKDCMTVHLPEDNPQLFAIELRNSFPEEYLRECLEVLEHILDDKDD